MIHAVFVLLTLAALAVLVLPLWRAPERERRPARLAAIVLVLMIPAGAGLIYAALGRPDLADAPYAARMEDPGFAFQAEALALASDLDKHPDAAGFAHLGEMLVVRDDGEVGPAAAEAFVRALMLDVKEPRARYYAGLALAQHGAPQKALAVWRALALDLPPDSPLRPRLRRSIRAAEAALKSGK
jgi:hypothetical protein